MRLEISDSKFNLAGGWLDNLIATIGPKTATSVVATFKACDTHGLSESGGPNRLRVNDLSGDRISKTVH
jgi:hypothetical protein